MGLQGSPASFARLIDYTMRGLQGVLTYIDNVLVNTFELNGIAPGKEKLQAVQDFLAPTSVKQIREFVGLRNYFWFLIPGFAFHSSVLTNLARQKSGPCWRRIAPISCFSFSIFEKQTL